MKSVSNSITSLDELVEQPFDQSDQKKLRRASELFKNFGNSLECAPHDYAKLDLFSDAALIELLNRHPRRRLQCFTMGTDPEKPEEWQAVCIAGVSGKRLFDAVKEGRIWINVTNIDHYDERYKVLIEKMYEHVETLCPSVQDPGKGYNTLVLASPGTQFYYHVNPENNMLWNMRGRLTVSALPAMDFRFVSQPLLEEIFAREASGSIPFKNEFEKFAEHVNAEGGDCVWWPQSAPIRMQYRDFCVLLVTSYHCPVRHRRDNVQLANRYLLRKLGIKNRSIAETGLMSELKQFSFRALHHFFPRSKAYDFTDSYITHLRVRVGAPDSLEKLDQTVIPEFSKFSELLQQDE